MKYRYELSRRSAAYLKRVQPRQQRQIIELIGLLCDDPFDARISAPLHGSLSHLRRARIGQIRLLYEVVEQRLVVYVTAIGPRGDVYKS